MGAGYREELERRTEDERVIQFGKEQREKGAKDERERLVKLAEGKIEPGNVDTAIYVHFADWIRAQGGE